MASGPSTSYHDAAESPGSSRPSVTSPAMADSSPFLSGPRPDVSSHPGESKATRSQKDSSKVRSGQAKPDGTARRKGGYESLRRRRPQSSGGFLLDSAFASEPAASMREMEGNGGNFGGDISLGTPRSDRRHRAKHSAHIGSSPLATMVTNTQTGPVDGSGKERRPVGLTGSQQDGESISGGSSTPSTWSRSTEQEQATPRQRSSTQPSGLGTDPAQIVRLALNLSESRRKGVAVPQLNVEGTSSGGRRVPSSTMPASLPDRRDVGDRAGSLKQHLQQQRRFSRHSARSSDRSARSPSASPRTKAPLSDEHDATSFYAEVDKDENKPYEFSRSTLARAEKARSTLELSAEYRRLLQHLPPLRPVSMANADLGTSTPQSRSSTGLPLRYQNMNRAQPTMDREYNPLQSIRNRKVRTRAKSVIDPESDGWNDISVVREWVDNVVEGSNRASITSESRGPLPSFPLNQSLYPRTEGDRHNARPSRSRHDWAITPAELLGDLFWSEEDKNRVLMEDREGNKLLPLKSQHGNGALRSSFEERPLMEPDPNEDNFEDAPESFQPAAKLADLLAASEHQDADGSMRGRHRHAKQSSFFHRDSTEESKLQKQLHWPTRRGRSLSVTSSGSSDSNNDPKIQESKSKPNANGANNAVLGKHMSNMLKRQTEKHSKSPDFEADAGSGFQPDSPDSFKGLTTRKGHHDKKAFKKRAKLHRERSGSTTKKITSLPVSKRGSVNLEANGEIRTSLDGIDSTAPNSPQGDFSRRFSDAVAGFVPSIASNMTPPRSRAASPARKMKRLLTSKPLTIDGENRGEHENVSENDFAIDDDEPLSKRPSPHAPQMRKPSSEDARPTSPVKKLFARRTDGSITKDETRSSSKRRRTSKEAGDPDPSRRRGLFKGNRLEEMLRSEVSKVGDLFWRREGQVTESNPSTPGLAHTVESSDIDDDPVKTHTQKSLQASPEFTDDESDAISRQNTVNSQPRQYAGDLPTFTSQSQRDDRSPGAQYLDHITRQQAARRDRAKSPRFERLAPPKIDIRNPSSSSLAELSRSPTRDSATTDQTSRRGSRAYDRHHSLSPYRSLRPVRDADSRLNDVLGLPGHIGRSVPPVTGLAGISASDQQDSPKRPVLAGKRQWSCSDRGDSVPDTKPCKKEFARVQALLLSSGVKAREIARRGAQTKDFPISWQRAALDEVLRPAPRFQQHLIVGKIVVQRIEDLTQSCDDVATHFRSSIVKVLLDQVYHIRDRISSELTPAVRDAADDADEFSRDLTTKYTLEVKQLNDNVELMMRRRRRRLRWLRRSGFILLEWLLLTAMWWVWLIVVLIRLGRGIVGGFVAAFRWLFWLS
ncbi:MAG: hypothetical protein M4579_000172 [Chaenotheca gracillima]|nr:MAG: hypothetical protein M4579_000172 [Chaenotheca gracillima]